MVPLAGVEITEAGGFCEVADARGVDLHWGAAGGVGAKGVVGEDETAEVAGWTVEESVAFHGLDAIADDGLDGVGGGEFDDGVVDALRVQGIPQPAADPTVDPAEEVLQAEGDAGTRPPKYHATVRPNPSANPTRAFHPSHSAARVVSNRRLG